MQSKIKETKNVFVKTPSENRVALELIRYYQQKNALKANTKDAFNETSKEQTLAFYDFKINSLKKKLHEINPERLQAIEQQAKNDLSNNGNARDSLL